MKNLSDDDLLAIYAGLAMIEIMKQQPTLVKDRGCAQVADLAFKMADAMLVELKNRIPK